MAKMTVPVLAGPYEERVEQAGFAQRLKYASEALEAGKTGEDLAACFNALDAPLLVAALVRRARDSQLLRDGIVRFTESASWESCAWRRTAEAIPNVDPARLGVLATQVRAEIRKGLTSAIHPFHA